MTQPSEECTYTGPDGSILYSTLSPSLREWQDGGSSALQKKIQRLPVSALTCKDL